MKITKQQLREMIQKAINESEEEEKEQNNQNRV